MAQWWVVNDNGLNILPGNAAYGAGGTSAAGAVQFRSPLDARRAASGKTPDAEYPDGYLGHIADRRTDKLIQAVKNNLTAKSYQRGVHKGSRVDPKDYLWPDGYVQPEGGIEREEATATRTGYTISVQRFSPLGDPVERLAHMGKTSGMATPGELGRKMEEARRYGVSPSMNPIVPPDPQIMMPRYRIARNGDYESGK
jgi:hypothetical protein